MRRLLFLIVLLFFLSLSACSVKLAYRQLDWWIPWTITDWVALSDRQGDLLNLQTQSFLYWHKTKELPRYIDFLRQQAIKVKTQPALTAVDFGQILDQLEQAGQSLLLQGSQAILPVAEQLDSEQIEDLFSRLSEKNAEFKADFIDAPASEQRERFLERLASQIEQWTGHLNDSQQSLLVRWSQQYHLLGKHFYQQRLAWQAQLRQVLQNRQQPNFAERWQGLSRLSFDRNRAHQVDRNVNNDFWVKRQQNRQWAIDYLTRLAATLTKQQKQHLHQKLIDYAQDFQDLSDDKNLFLKKIVKNGLQRIFKTL